MVSIFFSYGHLAAIQQQNVNFNVFVAAIRSHFFCSVEIGPQRIPEYISGGNLLFIDFFSFWI